MSFAETSRRDFLRGTGVLVVSFTLAPLVASCARGSAATRTLAPDQVDAFLAIDARGGVTVFSGKVDLGTGVRTAITQIAADELDVPLELVTVIEGDTALTPDQGVTSGSLSIEKGGMQIRQAAATARRALVQQAAQRLGVPAVDLVVENGTVRSRSGGKQVTYGELLRGRTFSLKIDSQAPLKDPASYTIVGRSVARLDIPAKVTGRFTFMQNVRVPGMLHGRVVRPPAVGAALQSVDEASVKSVPGLVKVVRLGNFLGVVAETEWGAITAARQLRATWSPWAGLPDESRLWRHVRDTAVVKNDVTSNVGALRCDGIQLVEKDDGRSIALSIFEDLAQGGGSHTLDRAERQVRQEGLGKRPVERGVGRDPGAPQGRQLIENGARVEQRRDVQGVRPVGPDGLGR